ncbi:MAG: hypothetical protein OEZ14_00260 [Acidimicrobiia bacterium]|nr:hypothetical protein [Acidimicrobiia bacterium]MDH5518940.1 hypothetical protein [Acidimicrobiia bacterium]
MTEHTRFEIDDNSTPFTHLHFKNDPHEFRFALVSDNSGGGAPASCRLRWRW